MINQSLFWNGNTTVNIADPDPQKDKNGPQESVKQMLIL
jgi:hypothetical protein